MEEEVKAVQEISKFDTKALDSTDKLDVVILQRAFDLSTDGARSADVQDLKSVLNVTTNEFRLSILNLSKLDCIDHPGIRGESFENFKKIVFTVLGREVLRACKI